MTSTPLETISGSKGRIKAILPSSIHLDAVRGASALLVLAEHFRYLLFADYPAQAHPSNVLKLLWFFTSLGHSAVVVFFVLSGYFISASIFRAKSSGRWTWLWYADQRLTRLYVVLIPSLAVGWILDAVGSHFFGTSGVYTGASQFSAMMPSPISKNLTLYDWLGNLFYLQGIFCTTFGSNSPLWSLSFEFWYYALFPLIVQAASSDRSLLQRLLSALGTLAILLFVGVTIDKYFLIWLMGVGVGLIKPTQIAKLIERKSSRIALSLVTVACIFFILVVSKTNFDRKNAYFVDSLLGLAISCACVLLLHLSSKPPNPIYTKIAQFSSKISYTLYLAHVPFLVLVSAALIGTKAKWQIGIQSCAESGLILVVLFAYVYVFWRLTEANTQFVRQFISQRMKT